MRCLSVVLAALVLTGPALGQDRPPQGIGFAQAEEGTWLCRHEDPQEALSCAREQCAEQAPGQECWATAWCYPANWSGTMVIWLGDFHTTQPLCGAPSQKALMDALAAMCAGHDGATHCDVTRTVDPDGIEGEVDSVSFPGPAAPAPPEGEPAATGETETGVESESAPAEEPESGSSGG